MELAAQVSLGQILNTGYKAQEGKQVHSQGLPKEEGIFLGLFNSYPGVYELLHESTVASAVLLTLLL